MSNLLKSKFFLGALVVAVMFVGAVAVKATPAKAECSTGTATLKVGSTGEAVKCLQAGVGATADGSFGPMTKAKVMAWQASVGLTADGVFGPMSRAKFTGGMSMTYPAGCMSSTGFSTTTGLPCSTTGSFPAGCTSAVGYSPTTGAKCDSTGTTPTGPLAGTDGTISDVNQLSQYNNEEVGAGQKDVKVLGFEVNSSKEGDIALKSAKVSFVITNASGSTKLDDYVGTVNVWQGATKVGTASVADFNKDSTGHYSKTITLSGSVVKADMTEKFYVSVDAISNLDSGDIDTEVATIGLDNLRFEDGSGVVSTDSTTGDLAISGVGVKFVEFSTASNTELKFSTNSTPEAGYVKVDSTEDTNNVVILKGKMKLDGTSDVWFDELPITLVTVGGANIDALVSSITLKVGSEEFTESLGANCVDETDNTSPATDNCNATLSAAVIFDNLDMDLAAGSTTNFSVEVDLNDLDAGNFDAGDSLTASLSSTMRGAIVAENAEGDQLADSTEMSGSVIGEAQTFYENGVNVVMGTTTYTTVTDSGNVTQVTYTIPMTVTAFGETLYTGLSAEYEADSGAVNDDLALAFELQDSTAPTTGLENGTVSSTFTSSDATIEGGTGFRLDEGETYHFTLQVIHTTPGTASRSYRVALNEFQTYTDAALNTAELIQTLTPTQNYQTGYQFITS